MKTAAFGLVVLCGGGGPSVGGGGGFGVKVVHAIDFPAIVTRDSRSSRSLMSPFSRTSDDESEESKSSPCWSRMSSFSFFSLRRINIKQWLNEWINAAAQDVEQRSLRLEKYWKDCDNIPDWASGMMTGGCHSKQLTLSVPYLSQQEQYILKSWGQCMAAPKTCKRQEEQQQERHFIGHGGRWTTPELVAIEQAVQTLAATLGNISVSRLGRMQLSILWVCFRFRNEYLLPLVLGQNNDQYYKAFTFFKEHPYSLTSWTIRKSSTATLAAMLTLYRHVQRASRCLLSWERLLILLALFLVGLVALIQEALESISSLSARSATAANSPRSRNNSWIGARRTRSTTRVPARLSQGGVSWEPPDYTSSSFFRVATPTATGSRIRARNNRATPTRIFRPRRLLLGLEQQQDDYETECPCCFEEYQITPDEFNEKARLPILSEACIHSYCLDCATRDRDVVMRRALEQHGDFYSTDASTARALSYLYGINIMDNEDDNNNNEDDDDDDDDYNLCYAVRCPFCREPDAFEVDRPILRPDAYAAYRKQKKERQILQSLGYGNETFASTEKKDVQVHV